MRTNIIIVNQNKKEISKELCITWKAGCKKDGAILCHVTHFSQTEKTVLLSRLFAGLEEFGIAISSLFLANTPSIFTTYMKPKMYVPGRL